MSTIQIHRCDANAAGIVGKIENCPLAHYLMLLAVNPCNTRKYCNCGGERLNRGLDGLHGFRGFLDMFPPLTSFNFDKYLL